MSVIDTSQWKEFRIGDLFEVIRGRSQTMRMLEEGNTPLIAAARANQGVAGYYDVSPEYSDSITVSCNGVGCGSVFYHDGPFSITGDASVMKEKQTMSRASKLFIAAICDLVFSEKYSYAEKCNPAGLLEEKVNLPATTSGAPDWEYMDSFMGKILEEEESSAKQLAALAPENAENGHFLDVSGWKAFRIGDLFNVCTTKSLDKLMLDLSDEYEYAYVGRTGQNNGILGYLKRQDFEPNEADTFSVVQIGEKVCCYQTQAWYVTQNIFKLKLQNHVSKNASLFLSSIITNTLKFVFGNNAYTSYPTKSGLKNLLISLPVTPDGQPDWAWMEQYMQQQMNKVEPLSKHLIQLL